MNLNRFLWVATIVLFSIVGAIGGWMLGDYYVSLKPAGGPLAKDAMATAVKATISLGVAIILARIGSWFADRYLIRSLYRVQQYSGADRLLGIVGALLGLLVGVLVPLPFPETLSVVLSWFVRLCVMAIATALGMALLQSMRGEMLRIFPQLEVAEENLGGAGPVHQVKLLDTNVIIDGRIADLCKTGFLEGPVCVPRFVLEEVQYIADSSDSMRRARGRRGLDVLNSMREVTISHLGRNGETETMPLVKVLNDIPASVQKIESVDSKLVFLAKEMKAAILTNDFNLNKVAELQDVKVLNINELAQALKPVVLPGEEMNLTIVKEGKEAGQGVGYLEDGTMVVVGDGARHVGETCKVVISSVYQTLAGKMIFADLKGLKGAGEDLFKDHGNISGGNRKSHENGDDFGSRAGSGPRRKGKP